MLTLGGVQEFIAASRRTADLWTASRLVSRLCQVAVDAVVEGNGEPVLPVAADVPDGLPNRIFAVVPAGDPGSSGPGSGAVPSPGSLARHVSAKVHAEWCGLRAVTFKNPDDSTVASLGTFPVVRWVGWQATAGGDSGESPPGEGGSAESGYEQGWRVVSAAGQARKRVRDFAPYAGSGAQSCSLCGRREGVGSGSPAVPGRLRFAPGERLCPVCAVKRDPDVAERLAGERAVFPSTASIATAPFRVRVVEALASGDASGNLVGNSGENLTGDSPGNSSEYFSGNLDRNSGGALLDAVRRHRDAVYAITAVLRKAGAKTPGNLERPGALPALEALARPLGDVVAGWSCLEGSWCLADTWQPESLLRESGLRLPASDQRHAEVVRACARGRQASEDLVRELARASAAGTSTASRPPASYLALIVQDADDMGWALSHARMPAGRIMREWHGQVSTKLVAIAGEQARALEEEHGRAVYAGGDDLLGLVPAANALRAAARGRELFVTGTQGLLTRPSVSTAIVFFHVSYPLQDALGRARDALKEAKRRPGKAGLALVVLRRGGERAASVLPWRGPGGTRPPTSPARSLVGLVEGFRTGLSPRLLNDMYEERHGIANLAGSRLDYGAEISRLVTRHSGSESQAAGFVDLVRQVEPATDRPRAHDVIAWVDALEVARFLAQEGR
ncbi:type III-B CRISPR-associated protein Cas10/Cmr2 [Protofrankia coriariae]|nr:type III-B CRISPR-associated protein Cas10/Cmr2 [Protofrankia coriariae]